MQSVATRAANGLDPNFGNGGIVLTDATPNTSPPTYYECTNAVAVQADGKTVLAGYSGPSVPSSDFSVVRLNADGSLDTTFGHNGKLLIDFGNSRDAATALAIQPDGRIVVGGRSAASTSYDFAFARLTPDGRLDSSFSGDGKAVIDIGSTYDQLNALALQPDGKIVAAGSYTGANKDFAVIRLLSDGSRDYSFGSGRVLVDFGTSLGTDEAFAVAVQKDGAIVVGGHSSNNFALARLLPDGTFDSGFSGDGKLTVRVGANTNHVKSLAIQGDGKIVAGGFTTYWRAGFALARFNPDGILDSTFSSDGMVTDGFGIAYSVMLGGDGSITLAGGPFAAARYTSTGAPDPGFGGSGSMTFNFGYTANASAQGAAMRPDGSIVMAGNSVRKSNTQVAHCVAGVTPSGLADLSFSQDGFQVFTIPGGAESAWGVAMQPDGKIIVAGSGSNGTNDNLMVMRHHQDGSPDTTFGDQGMVITPAGSGSSAAFCTTIQADGRILAAGRAANASNTDFLLVRYLPDGSLDSTFGSGGKVITNMSASYDQIVSVGVQSDGKIVACGTAGSSLALARYLPGGTLDPSFGTSGKVLKAVDGGLSYARSMRILPNGNIIVAGYVYLSGSSSYTGLALRFESNGAPDPAFASAGVARQSIAGNSVMWNGVAVQADGKLVLAGKTGSYANYRFALCRLNTNGSLDTSFAQAGWATVSMGTNDSANEVLLTTDGRIVAAGSAKDGAFERVAVVRMLADGSADATFAPLGKVLVGVGSGASSAYSFAIQDDGKVVLTGPAKGPLDNDFAVVRLEAGVPSIALESSDGAKVAEFSTIAFGLAATGTSGVARTLNIRNEGMGCLTIGLLALGGAHAVDFRVPSGALPLVLDPGGALALEFQFVPTGSGTRSATLAIASNDPANPVFQLSLSGLGNASPVFEGFAVSTPFGQPVIISKRKLMAKARDMDGDAMSVEAAAASANGAAVHGDNGEQWTYTPPTGFNGADSLPITITDSRGGSLTTAITIHVGPPPDAGGLGVNPPRLTRSPDGRMEIAFNGIPGRQYLVQRSLDLRHWETIATVTADASGYVRHIDNGPQSPSVFYRLAQP